MFVCVCMYVGIYVCMACMYVCDCVLKICKNTCTYNYKHYYNYTDLYVGIKEVGALP